ncbi:GNAT family N-acetyltransferase [Xinfangfangia pollutisoli]|uniref:GNAT family N-acetyltransferase n=1 Tax=Xinfangfangia pollutisoli TaxID=2865960 RepID=UPI001CD7BCBD|nr:GNAT family N-acetyltransferase [Xinfangfangia pollutisoli]
MIVCRDLKGLAEFRAAYAMQHAVWGDDDQADPPDLLMVIQAEGGIVAGAFDGAMLAGYVFGFPTADPEVQHSHRLAVLPAYRGRGLGAALKSYQRDWCRARGIRRIRWTYDPLMTRNANLNINNLGAIGTRYLVNYYGAEGSYQGGVESDRVVAELHVDGRPQMQIRDQVAVVPDFHMLVRQAGAKAQAARAESRAAMLARFEAGLSIVGFDPATSTYHFGA